MTTSMKKRSATVVLCGAVATAFLGSLPVVASAQDKFPSRPMRMVIPFPPGGSNDILGRFLAQKMTERMGQNVLADGGAYPGTY